MGKSAAMLQIALQAAEHDKGALIVSLEMRGKALLKRAMYVLGKVDSSRITQRSLTGPDRARLERAGQELSGLPLFVLDHSSATVESLRAVLREQNRKHPIRFCAVDYLQLMDAIKSKNSSRQEEVAAISRGLLALAREFEIPLLVLSQLSRACELRHNKRPVLSDLRESGQIEQDSNLVMALYRDEYYDPNSIKKGIAEVIILKQREGPVGTVELQWHPNHVAFRDLARCV
jgi:replicative DNA helicase